MSSGTPNACRFNETFGVQRDGAMTELIVAPPEKIYPADGLQLEELALVEPLTIGFHAVARGTCLNRTDTVAIFGCGGVGLGAIAGAARRGATVIGIDVDDAKLSLAEDSRCNPCHPLATRTSCMKRLRELTAGHGPDVVIEAIGTTRHFPGGR